VTRLVVKQVLLVLAGTAVLVFAGIGYQSFVPQEPAHAGMRHHETIVTELDGTKHRVVKYLSGHNTAELKMPHFVLAGMTWKCNHGH
jgi:hypothetical protein